MYDMMYQPFNRQQEIIRVNGIDGAKAYQMPPNSNVALFDANDDIFYVKSTDGAGFPAIRVFRFEEMRIDTPATNTNYVSREEMEEYVKQFIQQSTEKSKSNATNKSTTDADS